MAITINTQPSRYSFARSPMVYTISDLSNYTQAGFRYYLDVYIWFGDGGVLPLTPNYTLERVPDTGGYATFDISTLVYDELVAQSPFLSSSSRIGNRDIAAVAVEGYWESDASVGGAVQSNTTYALMGYTGYNDGINSSNNAVRVLTEPVNLNVPPSFDIPLGFITAPSGIEVITFSSFGSVISTVSVTPSDTDLSQLNKVEVNADMAALSPTGAAVTINAIDAMGAEIGNSITLTPFDNCKYGFGLILYVNKYGTWDFIPIVGSTRIGASVERSTYSNAYLTTGKATPTYDRNIGIKRINRVNGFTTIKANTGYQPEGVYEKIEQMLVSTRVVWYDGTNYVGASVTQRELTKKLHAIEKLVDYTLELEVGQIINEVSV